MACDIWKKTSVVKLDVERRTVTNEETMKIVATPILYEKFFFDCVDHTLARIVVNVRQWFRDELMRNSCSL